MLRRMLVVAMLFVFAVASPYAASTDVTKTFEAANEQYHQKNYDSAIVLYESLLSGSVESASLYFNLGNAYFKSGNIGYAMLNYLRADRLSPNDPDILENLEFARQFTRIQMEGVQLNPINSLLTRIVAPYKLTLLGWVSSALFILLMILLIFRYGFGMLNSATKSAAITVLVLLLVISGLTTFKYRTEYLSRRAVIVDEESTVRTGPSDRSEVELEAAPGLVVEIIEETPDYYQVLFENKRRGWITKPSVVEI